MQKLAPFALLSGKDENLYRDNILVGATIAPCTLQFKFENKLSTLLEKVIVTYEIKVISPSKELLIDTRQLRAKSCLQAIEDDLRSMALGEESLGLKQEIAKLESLIEKKAKHIGLLIEEEQRWKALIETMCKIP